MSIAVNLFCFLGLMDLKVIFSIERLSIPSADESAATSCSNHKNTEGVTP
jgi:hypothetical protein